MSAPNMTLTGKPCLHACLQGAHITHIFMVLLQCKQKAIF